MDLRKKRIPPSPLEIATKQFGRLKFLLETEKKMNELSISYRKIFNDIFLDYKKQNENNETLNNFGGSLLSWKDGETIELGHYFFECDENLHSFLWKFCHNNY